MEIKFRAKVEGKTVYSKGFIEHKSGIIIVVTKEIDGSVETSPIDKDTLCQFTGVSDKNKNEIYDKDKLTDGKIIYEVEYNTQNTGFFLKPISDYFLDTMNYQKLGNGYYSRKDLVLINSFDDSVAEECNGYYSRKDLVLINSFDDSVAEECNKHKWGDCECDESCRRGLNKTF